MSETNFPKHALVRTLKRFLLLTVQAAILLVGLAAAILSAEQLDSAGNDLAVVSFFSCLAIAIAGLALLRRVSRKWKLRWDAEAYLEFRARVRRSSSRTKLFERMRRGAMCLPSLLAAFVLFFLPISSHVAYAGRGVLAHYRVSIPVNWMLLRSAGGRFVWAFFSSEGAAHYGVTPNWLKQPGPSSVTLIWSEPWDRSGWWRPEHEEKAGKFTHLSKEEFAIGEMNMECWEYPGRRWEPATWVEILCSTAGNGKDFNLRASFYGERADKKSFLEVIRSARPQ